MGWEFNELRLGTWPWEFAWNGLLGLPGAEGGLDPGRRMEVSSSNFKAEDQPSLKVTQIAVKVMRSRRAWSGVNNC
jgi:hypothetical protein